MKSFTVFTLVGLATTALLFLVIDQVSGECCYVPYKCTEPDNKKVSRCYDCTPATLYCGQGKCNVFGCNCDGGCRAGNESLWCWNPYFNCGKHAKREAVQMMLPEMQLLSLIQKFDANEDLSLNQAEFAEFLAAQDTASDVHLEFLKLDSNADGEITLHEIDPKMF